MIIMEFKFNNYSRYIGARRIGDRYGGRYKREWYEWNVFMDEPADKLEKVRSVEYRLHETFPNPIRIVEDRNSRFSLISTGWGNFTIYITVYLKDGTEEHTKYDMDLNKTWPADEPT